MTADAGVLNRNRLYKMSEKQWDRPIGLNLSNTWRTLQAAVPALIEAATGAPISISASAESKHAGYLRRCCVGAHKSWHKPAITQNPWKTEDSIIPHGSQVLLRITACAAVALAISFVMAAPASAQRHHRTDGAGHHSAAHTSKQRPNGPSSGSSRDDGVTRLKGLEDDMALQDSARHGHDKCKRQKGNRPLLPWCTHPDSGWMGSTTLRVQSVHPEPHGICIASSANSCRPTDRLGPWGGRGFCGQGPMTRRCQEMATTQRPNQVVPLTNAMQLKIGRYDTKMIAFQPHEFINAMA